MVDLPKIMNFSLLLFNFCIPGLDFFFIVLRPYVFCTALQDVLIILKILSRTKIIYDKINNSFNHLKNIFVYVLFYRNFQSNQVVSSKLIVRIWSWWRSHQKQQMFFRYILFLFQLFYFKIIIIKVNLHYTLCTITWERRPLFFFTVKQCHC